MPIGAFGAGHSSGGRAGKELDTWDRRDRTQDTGYREQGVGHKRQSRTKQFDN